MIHDDAHFMSYYGHLSVMQIPGDACTPEEPDICTADLQLHACCCLVCRLTGHRALFLSGQHEGSHGGLPLLTCCGVGRGEALGRVGFGRSSGLGRLGTWGRLGALISGASAFGASVLEPAAESVLSSLCERGCIDHNCMLYTWVLKAAWSMTRKAEGGMTRHVRQHKEVCTSKVEEPLCRLLWCILLLTSLWCCNSISA